MPIDSEVRIFGLRVALYGIALMLVGIGLANQLHAESAATMSLASKEAANIVPMIPSIAGALLTLWGAIRLALVISRLVLAVFGAVLVVLAGTLPVAAAQLFPAMRTYHWSLASLIPVFTLRIVGLIFFSIAVLRWLPRTRNKRT